MKLRHSAPEAQGVPLRQVDAFIRALSRTPPPRVECGPPIVDQCINVSL